MLQNHYFAWLYEYKLNHPHTTLKTEYEHHQFNQLAQLANVALEGQADQQGQQQGMPIELYCAGLDCLEVSVPDETNGNDHWQVEGSRRFELLYNQGEAAATFEEAKHRQQDILWGIQEQFATERLAATNVISPNGSNSSPTDIIAAGAPTVGAGEAPKACGSSQKG